MDCDYKRDVKMQIKHYDITNVCQANKTQISWKY